MALQIRRGLEANLPASPAEGELLYATDSGNLYIGVSGSPNIINLASGGGGNSNVQSISDLSDVEIISGLEKEDTVFILPSKSLFDYQKRFKERVQASFSFG